MSEELTDNDIKLLKRHFNTKLRFIGIGLHKLIDEHKKTPFSILKMIIEEPKRKMEFSQSILITILAIAFTFAIGYESLNVESQSQIRSFILETNDDNTSHKG